MDFIRLDKEEATKSGGTPMGRQVIVAHHGNKPIPIGTFKSIIEGSGLSVDLFR